MLVRIFARHDLVDDARSTHEPALLLEGSWPDLGSRAGLWSLDEAVDGKCAWIDREASQTAEEIEQRPVWRLEDGCTDGGITLAYLNALKLRYYLVKLLRVTAFFEQRNESQKSSPIELHATRHRDEDYAELIGQVSRRHRLPLTVRWNDHAPQSVPAPPANSAWRRLAGRLSNLTPRPWANARTAGANARFVFCGDRRLLDGVCQDLLVRDCRVDWLYDRFSLGCFLRWNSARCGQLICDSSDSDSSRFVKAGPLGRIAVRGWDLSAPVERWLEQCEQVHGARQTRLMDRIAAHLDEVRPTALVLDEDATPLARAAVALARSRNIQSVVVQHGAPYGRLSFTPLAADQLLAWGESSRRTFLAWGVSDSRIVVTGSPRQIGPPCRAPKPHRQTGRGPRIVLLATTPPSDDRADSIAFHFTSRSHKELLRSACAAVVGVPNAELIVKLHPRTANDEVFRGVLGEFPTLRARLVRKGGLDLWLQGAACVLSCGSSAGIEAAWQGIPTIEIFPQGSAEILTAKEWGFLGVARTEADIALMLGRALKRPHGVKCRGPQVFASTGQQAAAMIAGVLLHEGDRAGVAGPEQIDVEDPIEVCP